MKQCIVITYSINKKEYKTLPISIIDILPPNSGLEIEFQDGSSMPIKDLEKVNILNVEIVKK